MKTPTFRFVFDRKKQATKKTKGLVQIEVCFNRQRKWIGTGVKVYSDQWKDRQMVVNHPQSMQLNDSLNLQIGALRDWANSLAKSGTDFEMGMVQRFIDAPKTANETFVDYVERKISERKDIRDSTKKTQSKLVAALKEFGGMTYFSDIAQSSVTAFDRWLHGKYSVQSTIHSYHKFLKIYVNMAIKDGLLKSDPYLGMRIDRGKSSDVKFLTEEEFSKLETADIADPSLCRVRDTFVFQCRTGMAYSDLAQFDSSKVENGVYKARRQKTGETFIIMLTDRAKAVLDKYGGHLPIISNQKYNLYLKTVAAIAGISKPVTSHMARHTFATLMLSKGAKIQNVAKMLGHADIATTQIYAKVLAKDVLEDFAKVQIG